MQLQLDSDSFDHEKAPRAESHKVQESTFDQLSSLKHNCQKPLMTMDLIDVPGTREPLDIPRCTPIKNFGQNDWWKSQTWVDRGTLQETNVCMLVHKLTDLEQQSAINDKTAIFSQSHIIIKDNLKKWPVRQLFRKMHDIKTWCSAKRTYQNM